MYDNKVPTKKRLQIVYLGENSKKKNLYGSIYDKTGALLGHFISAKMILYYLKKVKTIMNERSNAIRIICIISSDANIRIIYNIHIYVNTWVLSPSYTTVFLYHTAKKTQSNRQRRYSTEQIRTKRKRRGFSEWISEIINI